jgi:hypothetical protein
LPDLEVLPPRKFSVKAPNVPDQVQQEEEEPCTICMDPIDYDQEKKMKHNLQICKHHPHHIKCLSDW